MKTTLLIFIISCSALFASAQNLAPDQNPDFAVSRSKYMKVADSLTRTESITTQETYKAIDYLADKEAARNARKQFRRDLRMERARGNDYYYNNGWGRPYYTPYNQYYRNYRGHYYNYWNNPAVWGTVGSPFFWYWLNK